jgi:hypothetical protein
MCKEISQSASSAQASSFVLRCSGNAKDEESILISIAGLLSAVILRPGMPFEGVTWVLV